MPADGREADMCRRNHVSNFFEEADRETNINALRNEIKEEVERKHLRSSLSYSHALRAKYFVSALKKVGFFFSQADLRPACAATASQPSFCIWVVRKEDV